MIKKTGVLGIMLLCCSMAWSADNAGSGSVHAMSWAVGYDEGLSAKLFFTDAISAHIGVGYMVTGAKTPVEQPLNELLLKIGGCYTIKEYRQLRMNVFIEFAEQMKQGQVAYRNPAVPNMRYNQWNSMWRVGLAPEVFITDNFSLTYKFGFQLTYFGDTYKLNAAESGPETNDDNYLKAGVYGSQSDSPFMLLHNFAFMFYF
jgi:hypothetical protein